MKAINSSGQVGPQTDARAWGALAATDAWAATEAPTLSWQTATGGQIVVDIASNLYPNHGVTEWNCPNWAGTGSNELYAFGTVVVRLGTAHNKPASTWDHASAHEYGHALGLNHSGAAVTNVMGSSWPDTFCTGCRITASNDDIAGMNEQYK